MLKNDYLVAKIGVDTAENGPAVPRAACRSWARVPELSSTDVSDLLAARALPSATPTWIANFIHHQFRTLVLTWTPIFGPKL